MPYKNASELVTGDTIIERTDTGGIRFTGKVSDTGVCSDYGNMHAIVTPVSTTSTRLFCYDKNTTVEVAGTPAAKMAQVATHAA